eukprot:4213147-Prymnesium_polylepis.1
MRRQSVEGLSMLMFFCAVGGNLCYSLSIVLRLHVLLESRRKSHTPATQASLPHRSPAAPNPPPRAAASCGVVPMMRAYAPPKLTCAWRAAQAGHLLARHSAVPPLVRPDHRLRPLHPAAGAMVLAEVLCVLLVRSSRGGFPARIHSANPL